jgi:hypothetical protein
VSATRDRRRGRMLLEALTAVPRFASAPLYRRRHLRWGATEEEIRAPMPGDELLPKAGFNATRAITVDAPPELVWPWIVQMGHGRAGFYSYDLLDNAGHESADRILDEYQDPQVGDWMPMAKKVNETTAHRVAAFEPGDWLLWTKPGSTWAWKLHRLDGDRTRLVARLKQRYDWRSPGATLLSIFLMEFGDPPMMKKALRGIKARAERLNASTEASEP